VTDTVKLSTVTGGDDEVSDLLQENIVLSNNKDNGKKISFILIKVFASTAAGYFGLNSN